MYRGFQIVNENDSSQLNLRINDLILQMKVFENRCCLDFVVKDLQIIVTI